tara:strand:+ start:146 stop:358 length:213 start_codon:yes stop_codon:yes gene_type:complete
MKQISTYFKEGTDLKSRAEVVFDSDNTVYNIEYYNLQGLIFHTESFPGKSVHYVEDAAENWALGIKVLNG